MDKLICKAKTLDGRWVEGYYVKHLEVTPSPCDWEETEKKWAKHYIYYDKMYDWNLPQDLLRKEIDVKTLCRFTGAVLNGKQVFENDIIELAGVGYKHKLSYVVAYDKETFTWVGRLRSSICSNEPLDLHYILSADCSVVGNVFDEESKE